MQHIPRTLSISTLLAACALLFACSSPPSSPAPTPVPSAGPPQLTCPADISQVSTSDGPVPVNFPLPAAVSGIAPVTVTCSPTPGATFVIGTTAVTCTATDSAGRVGTCGFAVRVTLAPRLQRTRFMAFGDSLTAGVVSLRAPSFLLTPSSVSYPGRLQNLLDTRYSAQTISVDDEGLPGEKAVNGVSRLRSLLRGSRPEVVLLLEGANDINDGVSRLDPAASAVSQMVDLIEEAGALPFVAKLTPQRDGGVRAYHPELVEPFNDRLEAIAAASGVPLVDLYAAFGGQPTTDMIGADGLHPTEAGYQKIAETFFAAIKAKLEVVPPTGRASVR